MAGKPTLGRRAKGPSRGRAFLAPRREQQIGKALTFTNKAKSTTRVRIPATQGSDAHYGTAAELSRQNQMLAKKRAYEKSHPNRNAV